MTVRVGGNSAAWTPSSTRAGHIAGACSFLFRVNDTGIIFIGDRCLHDQPGLDGAPPWPELAQYGITKTVIVQTDCTYGAGPEPPAWSDERDRYLETLRQVKEENRPTWVAAFAVGRGGMAANIIQDLSDPNFPVFLDGMANAYGHMMDGRHAWCAQDHELNLSQTYGFKDNEDRYGFLSDRVGNGYAIVSPSGMGGPGGIGSTVWLPEIMPDPNGLICFTGYLAPDSDGYKIVEALDYGMPV